MVVIDAVLAGPEHASMRNSARELLREYRVFLEMSGVTVCFDSERFESEVRTLPNAYADAGGELLLACVDDQGAGCIAYRESGHDGLVRSCEIKRLFVRPAFRAQGIGNKLVASVMERAAGRGFARATLDTHVQTMPAAYQMYLNLGFTEYAREHHSTEGAISFLQCKLDVKA